MVKPPNKEALLKQTEEHEKFEMDKIAIRDLNSLSELSLARIHAKTEIPETLETGNFVLVGIKKYKPFS